MIKILEKDLEDIIFKDIDQHSGSELSKRGLHFLSECDCIVPIRQARLGSYGISDIITVGFSSSIPVINIIELKIVPFELKHLIQLSRYIKAVKSIMGQLNLKRGFTIRGVLIVESINKDDGSVFLPHVLDSHIELYTTEYNIDGIEFTKLSDNWYKGSPPTIIDSIGKESLKEIINVFKGDYRLTQYLREEHIKTDSESIDDPF